MSQDKLYKDGDIVWVKLGNNWWPGEVAAPSRHPEGLVNDLKRVPYCVVKFFNENTYEYVRSSKQIYPFQCQKREEFIRKGYSLYNSGNSFMEKFPTDVEVAKQLIRRKESSVIINDRPDSIVKAILGQPLIRTSDECDGSEYREKRRSGDSVTKILDITQHRNNNTVNCEKLRFQTSTLDQPNDESKDVSNSASNNGSNYQCNFCNFSSVRLNVMLMHRKMHSNRHSLGLNNLKSSKPTSTKLAQVCVATTATNNKNHKNQTHQNKIFHEDKNISKTKVSTIAARPIKGPSSLKVTTSTVSPSNNRNVFATETAVTSLKSNEKNNISIKLEAPTNIIKIAKKTVVEEKKEESPYATILSDFCPSETETSPPIEEKQSRRSLRHCKNISENTVATTIYIDLSETKTIKKIPKKREYPLLQLQNESTEQIMEPVVLAEPDVICLGDKEIETATITALAKDSSVSKADAEDIRKMLLADWSDDDETQVDAIVLDDSIIMENVKSNERKSGPVNNVNDSNCVVLTSTPVNKPSSFSIGRIRNIPKKDRRDIVLQDFNSDMSIINSTIVEQHTKTVAVDLDSSNSSVVEIVEDQQSAPIITINDDEDQENTRSQKNQSDAITSESKDNDSALGIINDKSTSAATSTTTLSCFDFQDDEDDQDNTTTTIAHFKKKYLSGDKLQNLSSNTIDDLRDDNVDKNRAELVEKDQRLAAEIETLLEQTQPTVADLLNANSFEESMSVKDLPIKERGKRIFKSRNRTRFEDNKTNTELVTSSSPEISLPTVTQAKGVYEANENVTTATEKLDNSKDSDQTESKSAVAKELVIISDQENIINKKCLNEISNEEVLFSTHTEIPKFVDDKHLTPNENENLSEDNTDCSEVCITDHNTSENQDEPIGKENSIPSDNYDENIGCEILKHDITHRQHEISKNYGNSPKNLDQEATVYQQEDAVKRNSEQERLDAGEQLASDKQSTQDKKVLENIEVRLEECHDTTTNTEVVLDRVENKIAAVSSAHLSEVNKDFAVKVKVVDTTILSNSQENSTNDVIKKYDDEHHVSKSSEEILNQSVDNELKEFTNVSSEYSSKNEFQKLSSETIFKIRVKSPEQLLNQALIIASQQEQELQSSIDSNGDTRLVTATPTDENSSMCASDTGAEFGSPTSMLSEERLPVFRFQSNETLQQEIETAETEMHIKSVPEIVQAETIVDAGNTKTADQSKQNFLKDKPKSFKNFDLRSIKQRRFSIDLNSIQPERKFFKRHRLSVDGIAINQEIVLEKPQEKSLAISQSKIEGKVRPKSRHMKITPRRNVGELFKEIDVQKSISLESAKEAQSVDDITNAINEEQLKTYDNSPLTNEIFTKLANEAPEKITGINEQVEAPVSNTEINEMAENENFEIPTGKNESSINSEEEGKNSAAEKLITENEITNVLESENKSEHCSTNVTTIDLGNQGELSVNPEENQQNLNSKCLEDILNKRTGKSVSIKDNSIVKPISIEPTAENVENPNQAESIDGDLAEIPIITVDRIKEVENNKASSCVTLSLDDCKTHKDQVLETPFSPGVPPPTPQEREVVIESDSLNQYINTKPETKSYIEEESIVTMTVIPSITKEIENSEEITKQQSTPKEKEPRIPFEEEVMCPLISLEKDPINDLNSADTPKNLTSISECEALAEPLKLQQPLDMVIEFESNVAMPCTPKESSIGDECENIIPVPSTPQTKDLIIEYEPSTPQDIIEYNHNLPAQVPLEKEVTIESDEVTTSTQCQNIIIEDSIQLEEKESLLERELQVIQPKETAASIDIPQELQQNPLQTDADKAAEEFLIEFDSIVNHSHTVEENMQSSTVEDVVNGEDLMNNIIEEVHEDHQLKPNASTKRESPLSYEPLAKYTVVTHKNSWNQIFKDSFHKQLPTAKRRQTICFEIANPKEGVVGKKQALDLESILPVKKSIKRTAERKLTLPAVETKFSNSHQTYNIYAKNHNQLTLNKKLITPAKRKLSIEDNITSFIIERPKQQQKSANAANEPPPLQRIRPLSRQGHLISKASVDNLSEPPPLQNHENLFHEFFPSDLSSSTQGVTTDQKPEGGRVIHQQIISSPTISSIRQNKNADAKISKNKQIGVDSRGNKYVIIKTPPTDIVVQPTLTSSMSAAVTAANNFGTTITIQPIAKSTAELTATKATIKDKNISSLPMTSSHKEQSPQQQMKQISITVPGKSPLENSNSQEAAGKIQSRNKRKMTQAKAVGTHVTTNSNINSAKHRQTMEALNRRLSIASEAPPLAKISRTSSTQVHPQVSNNSNITSFFADTQISNIAQQQLIQLQQQQHTQLTSSALPPPIILNKNAHQQSVIQRKTRKICQQQQSQLVHQQQQNQVQQQSQQMQQQQFITQIASQHITLQPPPLQQIQPQVLPIQQQIIQQSEGIMIAAQSTEDDNVIDSNTQLIALPTQPYPGYAETFLLCKVKGNTCKPVDNVPLYLNQLSNELVPVPLEAIEGGHKPLEHQLEIKASDAHQQQLLSNQKNEPKNNEANLQITNINCNLMEGEVSADIESEHQMHHNQQQQIMEERVDENGTSATNNEINEFAANHEVNTDLVSNNGILLNIEGQQVLLDASTFAHLLANPDANTQLISDDGTEYVLTHEVLAALQMQQEQQQALELANSAGVEHQQQHQQLEQTGSTDIIAVALAGSDLYDSDVLTIDTSQGMQLIDSDGGIVFPAQTGSITQQHLTPPAVVTNAVLDQSPIMSTLEVPSSIAAPHKLQGSQIITMPSHHLATSSSAALGVGGRSNLEDSLAAIGVTTQSSGIPSSLGLPITVTNPNIASKVTSAGPLNEMLQFVSNRPVTAAATAAAVAAAALAGESRIFTD